jgi:hypothetical protein
MSGGKRNIYGSLPEWDIAERLNALKAKKRRVTVIAAVIAAAVAVVIAAPFGVHAGPFGAFFLIQFFHSLLSVPTLICFAVVIAAAGILNKKYSTEAKDIISGGVAANLLNEAFDSVDYDPKGYVSAQEIRYSKLVSQWDSCDGSDLVKAVYNGVNITFSDITLTHESDDSTVTDFQGQWIIIGLNKHLKAHLRLIERKGTALFERKSNLETENVEFNKKYQILADDPHTAFLILTPQFMEYIVRMDVKANARSYLWFNNDSVHIALHNKRNLFELGNAFKAENLFALRERFNGEIGYIKGIADELLKNVYLFEKQGSD